MVTKNQTPKKFGGNLQLQWCVLFSLLCFSLAKNQTKPNVPLCVVCVFLRNKTGALNFGRKSLVVMMALFCFFAQKNSNVFR